MKKIALYTFILLATGFFSGCGEDFLDRERPLDFVENDVFSDPDKLEGNVISLYYQLKNANVLGGRILVISDNVGDDFVNMSGNGVTMINTYGGSVGPTIQENEGLWSYTYLAINKCNTFLEVVEGYKDVAGANYDRYVAEAKFIRALCYYFLYNMYTEPYVLNPNAKSVPLRIQQERDLANNDLERASSKQVLDQILADLAGSNALPNGDGTSTTIIRATKGAAEALKMRVYMILGEWQNAINAGDNVTGYSLVSDVSSIFKSPYVTSENIFSAPFSDSNRGSSQSALGWYYSGGNLAMVLDTTSIIAVNGYCNLNDDRISLLTDIPTQTQRANMHIKKFMDKSTYLDWVPMFRYAEIVLNKAECYANLGKDAEAIALLKQVRSRSLKPEDDTLNLDALTGDALKNAIYYEQRLEFLGEGHRGFNIYRRGETIVKQAGTVKELVIPPSRGTGGYIWPIPNGERSQNDLIG